MNFHDLDNQLKQNLTAEHSQAKMIALVAEVEQYADRFEATQVSRIAQAIHSRVAGSLKPAAENEYGADFSLAQEINQQLKAVRALRSSVMHENGSPKEGVDPKDLKDAITAANSMIGTLMKQHEKVMSMERNRAVESATVETLQQLKDEHGIALVDTYMELLEAKLEVIR